MRFQMASITEEVAELEQHQGWVKLFQEIRNDTAQYNYSCQVARCQENQEKNRYRDVSPFDHSRVKLLDGPSDYINSNLVDIKDAGRRYILSQGPLAHTSGQFWQMVWEQKSKAVVMLNRVIEKGMIKCHPYWPSDTKQALQFLQEGYNVILREETDMENFVIREFELVNANTNEARTVFQFHFVAWPDFDVPQSPATFLDFLACIREYGVLDSESGPAVIHCSAGIGRSGTFILIDTCLEYLQKSISFDISKTLLEMRKYRMGLVQTPQQLRFSYFAIAECERIIMYKQNDDDSYSESAGSDIDYDFVYDGGDEDLLDVETKRPIDDDEMTGKIEQTVNDAGESERITYVAKPTAALINNNVEDARVAEVYEADANSKNQDATKAAEKDVVESTISLPVEVNSVNETNDADMNIRLLSAQDPAEHSVTDTSRLNGLVSEPLSECPRVEKDIEQIPAAEADTAAESNGTTAPAFDAETKADKNEMLPESPPTTSTMQSKSETEEQKTTAIADNASVERECLRKRTLESNATDVAACERNESDEIDEEWTLKIYLIGGLFASLVFALLYSSYK